MVKVIGRLVALLIGAVIGAAVFGAAKPASDKDEKPSRRGKGWRRMVSYFAVDDMSRMRVAVSDWIERRGETHACDLKSSGGGATLPAGPLLVDIGAGGIRDRYHDHHEAHVFRGGSGSVSLGLPVVNTRGLRIYPLVGAGGAGGRLERDQDSPGWVSLFFTTGIGIDLRITLLFVKVVIGLRAGYRHELTHLQFGDGPEFEQPAGPFLRFIVGS